MVAIRLLEESLEIRYCGRHEKVFGTDLHELIYEAATQSGTGIDEYFSYLGRCFSGKGVGLDNEE